MIFLIHNRAMFVQNCSTDFGQELRVPQSEDERRGATNKKNNNNHKEKKTKKNDTSDRGAEEDTNSHNNKTYYDVKCTVCSTQIAVQDQDEVYHFFNVLASHS